MDAVMRLDAESRYRYAIKRIADNDLLYTVKYPDGDYGLIPNSKTMLFPIWSAKQYGELVIDGNDMQCIDISLELFENEIVDLICKNNWRIAVFPLPNGDLGKVITIHEFIKDLQHELEDYE